MKNLDRLKKLNVRSVEAKAAPAELSIDGLRRVTGGGNAYAHSSYGPSSCVKFN